MIRQNTFLSIFITLLTFASLLFIFPSKSFAVTPTAEVTKVQGIVIGPDGNPFKFATVYGTCDGKTSRGLTNSQGKYFLYFVGSDTCSDGAVVNVTAEKDGQSAGGSGIVQLKKDGKYVDLNISFLNLNFNVPEYGQITGMVAVLFSVGAYIYFRRRSTLAKAYINN